jgi:pimeloyl-ACP methyl ester carboxylesterase
MSIHQIDDVFDLVLAYEGAIRFLGLQGAPVIGATFGGILAAELAASFPDLFSRMILLAPAGLWSESVPWNIDLGPPERLPGLLFKHPDAPAARAMVAPPSLDEAVQRIWTLGCAAKFMWPVPDRGLSKRLHRVTVPTLVVWGEDDALIPVWYAREYGRLIPHSRVEVIPDCGHQLQVEQFEAAAALIKVFLDS